MAISIAVVLLATEIAVRMPLRSILTNNLQTAEKAVGVIGSRRISEHWKEVVLLRYARNLFVGTARLAVVLLLIAVPVIAGDWLASTLTEAPSTFRLFHWQGALLATLVAAIWLPIRGRLAKREL
ncbi:hypothetical protein [Blastopirellula marina]|uniref:hypothetical protein n=1 Tax=Blastopirellula marina TaxID=124 RepID=UPI0011B01723|nr:hypothetical protein [Blastopirellula marina]